MEPVDAGARVSDWWGGGRMEGEARGRGCAGREREEDSEAVWGEMEGRDCRGSHKVG